MGGHAEICIVTSDDDLWPGIETAIALGIHVVHIHTHSRRSTPSFYCSGYSANYTQLSF